MLFVVLTKAHEHGRGLCAGRGGGRAYQAVLVALDDALGNGPAHGLVGPVAHRAGILGGDGIGLRHVCAVVSERSRGGNVVAIHNACQRDRQAGGRGAAVVDLGGVSADGGRHRGGADCVGGHAACPAGVVATALDSDGVGTYVDYAAVVVNLAAGRIQGLAVQHHGDARYLALAVVYEVALAQRHFGVFYADCGRAAGGPADGNAAFHIDFDPLYGQGQGVVARILAGQGYCAGEGEFVVSVRVCAGQGAGEGAGAHVHADIIVDSDIVQGDAGEFHRVGAVVFSLSVAVTPPTVTAS